VFTDLFVIAKIQSNFSFAKCKLQKFWLLAFFNAIFRLFLLSRFEDPIFLFNFAKIL